MVGQEFLVHGNSCGVIRVGQKSAKWPAKVAPFLSENIYKPFGGRFEALAVSQTIWHGKTDMLRVLECLGIICRVHLGGWEAKLLD